MLLQDLMRDRNQQTMEAFDRKLNCASVEKHSCPRVGTRRAQKLWRQNLSSFPRKNLEKKINSLSFWVHGIFVQCPIYLLIVEFEQICWNLSSIVKKNKLDSVVFSLKNLEKKCIRCLEKKFIRCPSKFMEYLYNVPFTCLLLNLSKFVEICRVLLRKIS